MSLVLTSLPLATFLIMGISAVIAFINSGINRVLINFFVGWEQYRVMQKEMAEYRSETMKAARANDKKQMEKLKKRQSQINSMQTKMMKPQMVQFGISFIYLIVWFLILTPTFGSTTMAYVPGIGAIPVFYWYPICSLFFGLLSSRIIGIMPIET
ncbi:MAG: EMC3/TMCO1 family protein [Candidatus Bathyarchaeia archaeon]